MTTRDQARLMRRSGCPNAIVAERLSITARHARRCARGILALPADAVGTEREVVHWRAWYAFTGSYARVAERFGVSRQRVYQALS